MPFHNATKGNVMMTNTHNKILLVTGFQNTTSRTRIITPIGTSKEPQNILNQNYVLSLPLAKSLHRLAVLHLYCECVYKETNFGPNNQDFPLDFHFVRPSSDSLIRAMTSSVNSYISRSAMEAKAPKT